MFKIIILLALLLIPTSAVSAQEEPLPASLYMRQVVFLADANIAADANFSFDMISGKRVWDVNGGAVFSGYGLNVTGRNSDAPTHYMAAWGMTIEDYAIVSRAWASYLQTGKIVEIARDGDTRPGEKKDGNKVKKDRGIKDRGGPDDDPPR